MAPLGLECRAEFRLSAGQPLAERPDVVIRRKSRPGFGCHPAGAGPRAAAARRGAGAGLAAGGGRGRAGLPRGRAALRVRRAGAAGGWGALKLARGVWAPPPPPPGFPGPRTLPGRRAGRAGRGAAGGRAREGACERARAGRRPPLPPAPPATRGDPEPLGGPLRPQARPGGRAVGPGGSSSGLTLRVLKHVSVCHVYF